MVEETKQIDKFNPEGLSVLVADDDPLSLAALERMLRQCHYSVTTCDRVSQAISLVMERSERRFDIVISDVYLPYEDGFGLLDVVRLQLDIPVILMSANGETNVVMKAITHGACDYLIKPVRMEVLRNIWQHVIRRRATGRSHGAPRLALIDYEINGESDDAKAVDSPETRSRKRKQVTNDISCHRNNDLEFIDDISGLKRSRVNWTVQLHEIFVRAVNQLGVDKAVPKRILDIMKVNGLTRENVASHLQKYRLYLKRLSGSIPEPHPIASFQAAKDGKSGGTMQICPSRRLKKGPPPSSSSSFSSPCFKGPGLRLGFRSTDTGAAAASSVEQCRTCRQNLAIDRSAGRLGAGTALISSNVQISKPTETLYRMSSLNLDSPRGIGDDLVSIQDLETDPFGLADEEEEEHISRVQGISWMDGNYVQDFPDNFVEEFRVCNEHVRLIATPPVVNSLEQDPVDDTSERGHVFDDFLPQPT